MSKIISKGSVWKMTIASILTPLAQVLSLEFSGAKAETYESTALDTVIFKTKDLTGYTEPGNMSAELFYDPSLAGHKALSTLMGWGVVAPVQNAMSVTYADALPTVQAFLAASVAFGATVDMGSGLKAKIDIEITGDPGFAHT